MIDQLVRLTLAAQAADEDGLAKDPKVQARLELLRTQVLAEAASEKYIKSQSSPVWNAIEAEYDAQVAAMPEYKAQSSSTRKEGRGDDCEARIGRQLLEAQLRPTRRTRAARTGGDLGWFSQTMVKAVRGRRRRIQGPVAPSSPCRASWLARDPLDVRSPEAPAFEQVKPQVEMFQPRAGKNCDTSTSSASRENSEVGAELLRRRSAAPSLRTGRAGRFSSTATQGAADAAADGSSPPGAPVGRVRADLHSTRPAEGWGRRTVTHQTAGGRPASEPAKSLFFIGLPTPSDCRHGSRNQCLSGDELPGGHCATLLLTCRREPGPNCCIWRQIRSRPFPSPRPFKTN